jgi:threonyl-tRNA synthetase
VVVAAIVSDADAYCQKVVDALKARGIRAEADLRNEKINYKIREHSVGKVPVILACGMKEVEDGTVSVRRLGENATNSATLDAIVDALAAEATPPDLADRVN